MENSSVNTFTDGLVMDLNPLVTPKTVLTDVINGTLLTFNGDELSLQNDAGNTKISTDNGGYVQLSQQPDTEHTEFFPLGIKEYGGVLYIISGSLPIDNSVIYNNTTTYNKDDIVRTTLTGENYYYRSIIDNNSNKLPYNSNEYWEVIGTLNDFNNRFGVVEFGSYPSPELSGVTLFEGDQLVYDYNLSETDPDYLLTKLYHKYVINDADFKTTRFIEFSGSYSNEPILISGKKVDPSDGVTLIDDIKFYKVSLYQQLHNGYLDITEDIWNSYYKYKGTDIQTNFWFLNDPNFRYYSQTLYVGKLAIEVTIEDLEYFRIDDITTIYNAPNFDLHFEASGVTRSESTYVSEFRLKLWINGEPYEFPTGRYYKEGSPIDVTLPDIYDNAEIYYEITVSLNTIFQMMPFTEDDFPSEFTDKYRLSGTLILHKEIEPNFELTNNFICSTNTGFKQITEVILTDQAGNYIDINLNQTANPNVFVLQGETATTPSAITVGEYTITDKITEMVIDPNIPIEIENTLEGLMLEVPANIGECESTVPFTPYFLALNENDNTVEVISQTDGSEYKALDIAGFIASPVDKSYYSSTAYDATDKLLFIGGASGVLYIYDISNVNSVISRQITVCTNDISSIDIVNNTQYGKRIAIGEADQTRLYLQQYESNINNYVTNVSTPMQAANFGWIRNTIVCDDEFYVVTQNGYTLKSGTTNWQQVGHDTDDYLLRLRKWFPSPGQKLVAIETSGHNAIVDINTMDYSHFDISKNMKDFVPTFSNLVTISDSSNGCITQVNPDLTYNDITPTNITYATGIMIVTDEIYISVQTNSGEYKIINLIIDPGGSLTWGENQITTPRAYQKLYEY